MGIKHIAISALCVFGMARVACAAPIATTPSSIQPMSQYGLIQNVQNYSSNPFWNPNGAYNQRMPQAIFVQGADLNTADCQRTVGTLIASYCVNNNNCVGMRVSDIRPAIMLQMARLPGHNYATSCAGFIDSEFADYIENYSNAGPSNAYVAFPSGTVANPNRNDEPKFEIENPYQIQNRTWNNEEWEHEKKERIRELEELQSQNGANDVRLARAEFPATANDLSFTDRLELKTAGYDAYKNASAYVPIEIESEKDYLVRKKDELDAYCKLYPNDSRCPKDEKKDGKKNDGGGDEPDCTKPENIENYDKCPTQYCEKHPDDEKCKTPPPVKPYMKPSGGEIIELVLNYHI